MIIFIIHFVHVDLDAFMVHGGSLYNGQHQVLYYADCTSEMAFVVPSKRIQLSDRRHSVESKFEIRVEPLLLYTPIKGTLSFP